MRAVSCSPWRGKDENVLPWSLPETPRALQRALQPFDVALGQQGKLVIDPIDAGEAFDAAITEAAERRKGFALPFETEARVARHIVEMARRGVHDRDGLRNAALSLLPH